MTIMSDNERTNIYRYEPLLDCLDQEELRYLKDTDALQMESAAQRDRYLAFQEEKLSFMVRYLAKKDDVLAQLGLGNVQPKPRSRKTKLIVGSYREPPTATQQISSAPIPQRELLQDYCQHGMNGIQRQFDSPPRDKQKARKLLKKVKAAWRRKVTRMTNRQLLVDIPPELLEAIDKKYYNSWRHITGNITKSRNDMLNEWLREKSSPPRIRSPFTTGEKPTKRDVNTNPTPEANAMIQVPDTSLAPAPVTTPAPATTPAPVADPAPVPELGSLVRYKPPSLSRELFLEQSQKAASDKDGGNLNQLEIKTAIVTRKAEPPLDDNPVNKEDN